MILNFTLEELCASSTAKRLGISNVPSVHVSDNLMLLIVNVLQPLRTALKKPVIVSSGFRNEKLNKYVGGVNNSQHLLGQAADITVPGMTVKSLFEYIKKSGIVYDQLIDEGNWVHISYNRNNNRRQAFKA